MTQERGRGNRNGSPPTATTSTSPARCVPSRASTTADYGRWRAVLPEPVSVGRTVVGQNAHAPADRGSWGTRRRQTIFEHHHAAI